MPLARSIREATTKLKSDATLNWLPELFDCTPRDVASTGIGVNLEPTMRPEFCNIGPMSWDVNKAHQIVSDGRHPVLQPVDSLLGFNARRRELPDGRIEIKLGHRIKEAHIEAPDTSNGE